MVAPAHSVWTRTFALLQAQQSRAASTASCSALQSKWLQNSQPPQSRLSEKPALHTLASRPQWSRAGQHRAEHQQPLQVAGLLCQTPAVMTAVRTPEVNTRMMRMTASPRAVARQTVHSMACSTTGIALLYQVVPN